ncbi:MAG TPA: MFS transporter [Nitrososphaerales archaeon]|nr:MFS transporter [Nitrososphaerales archaeon]
MTGASTKRVNWVYSTLPVSLATGSIGTMVQLYIIQLNGIANGTLYASLAVAFFNGVSIPAAIFWGYTTDKLHRRKAVIFASYLVMATVLVSFYGQDTVGTIAQYSVYSFISAAAATPLNLLIMESEPKNKWADTFAKLSMASGIGNVLGLVLSTLWVQAFPLILLSIPFGIFSLISAVLSLVMIRETEFVLERETIVLRRPSFFSRLLALPLMFIGLPSTSDFKRAFRGLKYGVTSYVPLLYISIIFFYLSSGIFNTSFVPAMSSFAMSSGAIFGVILSGIVVQTLAFQYFGRYLGKRSLSGVTAVGLIIRAFSYLGCGLFALVLAQPLFALPALILYPLGSGIAFAMYYTASNTMVFNSVKGNPGSTLGVYSAIVGSATFVGSILSGFISIYLGFYATFSLGGVLLILAIWVVLRLRRLENPAAAEVAS